MKKFILLNRVNHVPHKSVRLFSDQRRNREQNSIKVAVVMSESQKPDVDALIEETFGDINTID